MAAPPGSTAASFGAAPSTLMMFSAAPGASQPTAVEKGAVRTIEASLDPPSGEISIPARPASLDPPMPRGGLDPPLPPGGLDPPVPPPALMPKGNTEIPKVAAGAAPGAPAAPGASSAMKSPPTSKPFNITGGPALDAKAKPEKSEKNESEKSEKSADKSGDKAEKPAIEKAEKTGEEARRKKKPPPPTNLVVVEESSSMGTRLVLVAIVVAIGLFVAFKVANAVPKTSLGGGKGVSFGVEGVRTEPLTVGARTNVSKFSVARGAGELTAYFIPEGGGFEGAGGELLLVELLGKQIHVETPRTFGGVTILNGEVRLGEKNGRLRAFFTTKDAWVLTAMSQDPGWARSPDAERFLSSFDDLD